MVRSKETSTTNKKIMYLLVAIFAVAIAVAGVGAYVILYSGGGDGAGNGGEGDTYTLENATSLRFNVDLTGNVTTEKFKYTAKNLRTTNLKLRIEILSGDEYAIILNGAEQKAWTFVEGAWKDVSDAFDIHWNQWKPVFEDYVNHLEDWPGIGDWTYTTDDGSVRVYNIDVNPELPDTMFQPPS